MRLFVALLILMGLYVFVLLHTTNIVLSQTQKLNATYQYVVNNSSELATGR